MPDIHTGARPARAAIVIPTYDEKENIGEMVAEVLAQQPKIASFELHVVVADSLSRDGTAELVSSLAAQDPRVHLVSVAERGIGAGLYNGFRYGIDTLGAAVLVEMDADFQHNPSDIPRLLAGIAEGGYDVVVGSRFVRGSVNQMVWYRRVLSVVANNLIRLMLGLRHVKEITTSYRAFRSDTFEKVPPDAVPWHDRSFIAVPIFLVRMIESGARVAEIPMTMHTRTHGYSKMVYWKYIRDIMRFCVGSWAANLARTLHIAGASPSLHS